MPTKQQILEREQRWRMAAGIAAVAGVALIIASFGDSAAAVRGGEGAAQRLADVEGAHGRLIASGVIQLIGWSLLAIPLAFLFKAAAARAPRMRSALIGVVVVAPILIGAGGLIGAGSVIQASDDFANLPSGQIEKCVKDKAGGTGAKTGSDVETDSAKDSGSADEARTSREQCEDEAAQEARRNTSFASLETGIGLAGLFGFTVAVVYTALWAMRTGLLSRFWGALGLALGAVFVFFTLFTLAWFVYLGLLLVGWVPGGRPPAWAAGEAVEPPQPKGGGLFGPRRKPQPKAEYDGPVDKWGEPIEGSSEELAAEEAPEPSEAPELPGADETGDASAPGAARRKRKKRGG